MFLIHRLVLFCGMCLSSVVTAQGSTDTIITGAGATFPSEIYTKWANAFIKERQIEVKYSPIGSGEGVKKISTNQVDFGATDVPISAVDVANKKFLQFPTLIGAVVPIVNLPSNRFRKLRLTGDVLAEIFSGQIDRWNHPRIRALNPASILPSDRIVRIVRADSSGTTAVFSQYLGLMNNNWPSRYSIGNVVNWDSQVVMVGGNDGVIKALQNTPYSISYTSFDRVIKHRLDYALLQNREGNFVEPTESGMQQAVRFSDMYRNANEYASLLNQKGAESWPIVTATFVLIDPKAKNESSTASAMGFFFWAFRYGDGLLSGSGFSPLPTDLQARVLRKFSSVQFKDIGNHVKVYH